jgi:hypothetical protein
LAHDIIRNERGLYSLHIKVKGIEYGIVHVPLPFGGSVLRHVNEYDEDSRLALLEINHRIRHKGPVDACCGTYSG